MRRYSTNKFLLCLALLCMSCFSLPAQYKHPVRGRQGISVYAAPLALSRGVIGRSVRLGIEQHFAWQWSIGAEFSKDLPTPKHYDDLRGHRWQGELRRFSKKDEGAWFGINAGALRQDFGWKGELFNPADSTTLPMYAKMNHRAKFLRLGIGFREQSKSGWLIDGGVWLGVRKRDMDVEGMTEEADDYFWPEQKSHDWVMKSTTDTYWPEALFSLRVGYHFGK